MDEKYTPHVQITGRDENGPAIDVEALMSGTGDSLDDVMTAIDEDGAQADMSGFAKAERGRGRTNQDIAAAIAATARGQRAKFMPKLADVLR
jgi:hypothetical protein